MREIKFRIFDKQENEYCEEPDYRWMLSRNGKLYNSENDEWYNLGGRFIVEFFTGLTDKNGKEIYEGDILKYYDDCWEKNTLGKIIWENSTARFTANIGEQFIPNFVSEIIGNIHDNPELLKS